MTTVRYIVATGEVHLLHGTHLRPSAAVVWMECRKRNDVHNMNHIKNVKVQNGRACSLPLNWNVVTQLQHQMRKRLHWCSWCAYGLDNVRWGCASRDSWVHVGVAVRLVTHRLAVHRGYVVFPGLMNAFERTNAVLRRPTHHDRCSGWCSTCPVTNLWDLCCDRTCARALHRVCL